MNINAIYRHTAELEAEATLSRVQPYPEDFTLAERTAERMTRARNGLAHVMTDLATQLNDEQAEIVYCWLSKVLTIVDMARIDAEGSA
ncbi:TPA: nicotinic acetylcholine receptor subunit beta [Klebsiella pneumoniae]|uniref:nicotinic acetylcholine receptor subunit beta n=1 Tax=Klebsiella pneumoniae TaxID=573 RepID=UPI000CEBADDD|nr:nicotinic acetylcholine receptor subunit beta [Klebsiella pneumoniae]MCI7835253.1 nicotinic acetylcholine receptor subunit beta [Klebsiella pneumoniae]MCI8023394.1 nicotinic acetylcholine receptor subunit beta [Klebsiella pneumoniae]ROG25779.1 nicotinic acetylcholine receptor subunit beta [Klebsiella pneumoniae subsp. pneumoniae]HBR2502326.1 nicotinic acetylcholine receptor subunit beta [Klebsiella pneumoniae]HBR2650460.1 nicotinic acetylcholine receptor subunit beta [Klebsiella pneumoniae]